jgi:hypothetical protein
MWLLATALFWPNGANPAMELSTVGLSGYFKPLLLGPGTAKFPPEQEFAMGEHPASFPAFEAQAS